MQAAIIRALLGLLGAALVLAAVWGKGYATGNRHGSNKVQQEWDSADRQARNERDALRKEGAALADALQKQLAMMEAQNAQADELLRAALRRPFTCPASGRVGDVELPADLVDSMFNRTAQPRSPASGNAGSKPAR